MPPLRPFLHATTLGELRHSASLDANLVSSHVAGKSAGSNSIKTSTPPSEDGVGEAVAEQGTSTGGWALGSSTLLDLGQPAVQKAVAVEFMAQVLFNYASCSGVAVAMNLAGGAPALIPYYVVPFHFFLLYVLIGATQPISGGHFNPMVTCCVAFMGGIPAVRVLPYILAQLLGGTVGSALQFNSLPYDLRDAGHAAVQAVPDGRTLSEAFLGEATAAWILMAIVCFVAFDPKGNPKQIPLAMSLTVAMLILIVGPVSSMCINPARAFGPAIVSGFWEHHWLWWTAPFIGGFCAVVPYRFLLRRESQANDMPK